MKIISLNKAYSLLETAIAVIIDDDVLVYPSLSQLTGNEENEFLYLSWDYEHQEYYMVFLEGDNTKVKIEGSDMFLFDHDSEESVKLTLLTHKILTKMK